MAEELQVTEEQTLTPPPPFPYYPHDDTTPDALNAKQELENRVETQKEKDRNIRESNAFGVNREGEFYIGDKWKAFSDTWDDTWFARMLHDYQDSQEYNDIEDEEFMQAWTDDAIVETIVANKLPMGSYQNLRGAKNEQHRNTLVKREIINKRRDDFINKTLNSYGGLLTERSMSSLTTGFMDIDLPITLVGGLTAKSAYSLMSVGKANAIRTGMALGAVGAHGLAAKYIYESSNGELSASETTLFGLLGAGFDGFMVNRIGRGGDDAMQPPPPENQFLLDAPDNPTLIGMNKNEVVRVGEDVVDDYIDVEIIGEVKYLDGNGYGIALPNVPKTGGFSSEELTIYESNSYTTGNPSGIWAYDPDSGYIDMSPQAQAIRKARGEKTRETGIPRDATDEELNTYLIPKEGTGSYTQYNKREEAAAASKYGKGTPKYNKRLLDIAYGKYQHLGSTTRAIAKQTGKSFEWLRTPEGQEFAQAHLIKQNRAAMKKAGIPVTPSNYYVFHQLGAPRAKRFFSGKLTAKDYKVLYDNLPASAQKRAIGNPALIVDEWKRAYTRGSTQSLVQRRRRINTDIDNVHKRRKQDEGIKDEKKRKDRFKETDKELEKLKYERTKLDNKINDEVAQRRRQRLMHKDYRAMADDLRANIASYGAMIRKAWRDGDQQTIKDVDNIVERLYQNGYIPDGEYAKYKNRLENNQFKPPELKVTQDKDGNFQLHKSEKGKGGKQNKGVSKALVPIIGIGLTAEAMAGDGDGADFMTLLAGAAALGLGIKNFGTIKNSVGRTFQRIRQYDNTRDSRGRVERVIDELRTSLTETISPLLKDKDKEFVDFVKKTLWDAENGDNLTIERNKASIFHGLSGMLHRGNDLAYNEWLREIGTSRIKAALTNIAFGEMSMRMRFEIMVAENIEMGRHADSAAITKASENVKSIYRDLRQQAIDSGVKGAEDMFDIRNYFPRYFRGDDMAVQYRSLSKAEQESFINQFAKMFVKRDGDVAKAREAAKEYFDMVTSSNETRQRFTTIKQIQDYIDEKGLKHITAEEMAEDLGIASSQAGRTKKRIYINKSAFETITVTDLDGNLVKIELNDMFVNNSIEATDRLINNLSGHIAFADAGFKSIDEAREIAAKGSPRNAKVMNEVIDSLLGEPILDVSSMGARVLEAAQNFTTAFLLPFSAISLTQEVFTTLVKNQGGIWIEMVTEGANIFQKHGASSALVDELSKFIGQGQHTHSASYGAFSHIGANADNMSTHTTGFFNKTSQIARDFTLYNLGLIRISDFLTKINMVDSITYLYDISHGTKKMPAQLRKAVGLTPEIEEMIRNRVKKSNGQIQKLELDTWTREERLQLKKVMDNMMMKRIQQTTQGGTPHWGRSTEAGVVATQLLKFPLQAFSNHGIYDLKGVVVHKDPRAAAAMFAWFTGGYMASVMRAEAKGYDKEHEDHMVSAMLSMPIIGAPEALKNLLGGDTAMTGVMGDISQSVGVVYDNVRDN